jgi:hypothetical protein
MTIEILKPKNTLIIGENSPGWQEIALLFMKYASSVGPDQSRLLWSRNGKLCMLRTHNHPDHRRIDTTGHIEISRGGEIIETIPLNQDNPIYMCSEDQGDGSVIVEQAVRYRPFSLKNKGT